MVVSETFNDAECAFCLSKGLSSHFNLKIEEDSEGSTTTDADKIKP